MSESSFYQSVENTEYSASIHDADIVNLQAPTAVPVAPGAEPVAPGAHQAHPQHPQHPQGPPQAHQSQYQGHPQSPQHASPRKTKRLSAADKFDKLVDLTQGTVIGSEFNSIGLHDEEKLLIERLVDSISKLTSDMLIDSKRKPETLRRIRAAIDALDGF